MKYEYAIEVVLKPIRNKELTVEEAHILLIEQGVRTPDGSVYTRGHIYDDTIRHPGIISKKRFGIKLSNKVKAEQVDGIVRANIHIDEQLSLFKTIK